MIEQKTDVYGLKCLYSIVPDTDTISYILYPFDVLGSWITEASGKYKTSIIVITGMDWQDDLTPWPAKGVPKGTPDFKGDAVSFLKELEMTIEKIESTYGLSDNIRERNLIGVSLSGLFTLWQWTQCRLFDNIACLSGSFWYEGFKNWFVGQNLVGKHGLAYFLLGDKEEHSKVKEFRSVGNDTRQILSHLDKLGIRTHFDSVPGDHYSDAIPRLDLAVKELTSSSNP